MLKKIKTSYFIIGCTLFIVFSPWVTEDNIGLYILNIFTFLCYYFVIHISGKIKISDKKLLFVIVFWYSLFFVFILNLISWYAEGNFYVFSKADALNYHRLAVDMVRMDFFTSIDYFLNFLLFDDLGMIIVLRTVYLFVESNLAFNLLNIFVGATTAVLLYNLSRYFMDKKYAQVCAVSYSLSSFMIWFYASGLKEALMVMLIVFAFERYYKYRQCKNISDNILFHASALSLILFRPVLMLFIYISIVLSSLLIRKRSVKKFAVLSIVFAILIVSYSLLQVYISRFFADGSIDSLIEIRKAQGMVIGSVPFTYSVNVLAQLIGPLPTIVSEAKHLLFYVPGLIFRVLIAFPFWLGTYYIFKFKKKDLYPLLFFVAIEMASLALIIEGLELRKSLSHLPMVYIVSFWFMYEYRNIKMKKKKLIGLFSIIYGLLVLFALIGWSIR